MVLDKGSSDALKQSNQARLVSVPKEDVVDDALASTADVGGSASSSKGMPIFTEGRHNDRASGGSIRRAKR